VCEWPTTDEPAEPTPGERLLYALGQLFKQWHVRATLTPPHEVDVEAVAKMLGVWGAVEFAQNADDEDEPTWYLHLPGEVLVKRRLLEIAAVFDEAVAPEDYPLALLVLGHRARTLFRAFLELQAGAVPVARRALVRPMLEIKILVRFLRKDPDLHVELWQAEADRNTVTIADEIRRKPHIREAVGEDPLDDTELAARRAKVEQTRKRALAAGLRVGGSAVLPSISEQLQVIDDPAADIVYTTAYRAASWDVHTAPRAFLVGTWTTQEDGRVSYAESPSLAELLGTRALAVGIVASTVELIAHDLHLPIEHEAFETVRR
jgi:hypothetical protein